MSKAVMTSILLGRYGGGLADQFLNAYVNFRYNDGFNLSDRIWRIQEYTQKGILDITIQGIMSGISAVELAKQVEGFLLRRGPAWTTGIKRSITGRGTVAYNALRLARTEINQAYHWAQKEMAKENPLIIGQKWNLSNSHPTDWPPSAAYMGYPEICDYRALHDHHGLGEGVFPPGEAPPDHPNGLCYLTDVWKPVEEILDLLGDPDPDWMGGESFADTEDSFIDARSEGEGITNFMQYQREFRDHLPEMEYDKKIKTTQEDFKAVGKDLDSTEARKYVNAIYEYSDYLYKDIRRAQVAELKEGKPIENARLKEKIDLIEEYIASAPLYPKDVPLYRGFGSRNPDNLQAFEDAYVNGVPITMHGISSWTSRESTAHKFVKNKEHVALFELVSNKTGVSIKHLSMFPGENEVLFGT
ncbi:MAG TPA: hypothetical protein GX745_08995, partial [Clostridiales bacterium]|nr:hypothetical protein [Clostridiales bacterium]